MVQISISASKVLLTANTVYFLNITRDARVSGSSEAQKVNENLAKFHARRSVFEGVHRVPRVSGDREEGRRGNEERG